MKTWSPKEVGGEVRPALAEACELLEKTLNAFRENIRDAAEQFTSLAEEVRQVLDLTSEIVFCAAGDCAQSIVPIAGRLGQAARRFLDERIAALSRGAEVFSNEQKMLEALHGATTRQRAMIRQARALSVMAAVEVARLGEAGRGFEYMARELDAFSTMVTSGADEVGRHTDQRRSRMANRQQWLKAALERMRAHFEQIDSELGEATAGMDRAVAGLERVPAEFRDCLEGVSGRIERAVAAVQIEDVTRQQTEHVREALLGLLGEIDSQAGPEPEARARRAAILRIQTLQLESARTSAAAWIAEIDECVQDILRIGSDGVDAIGAGISEQQQGLARQLEQIDRLEQESAAGDAELSEFIGGLGELIRLARGHMERSQEGRDRMQLLNFNSMIEARRVGGEAAVVLEIARHISLLSAAWGELTKRSGEAMESMLGASERTEAAHRQAFRASSEMLAAAESDCRSGLETLERAAGLANRQGKQVQAGVEALRQRTGALRRVASRLREALDTMEQAKRQMDAVGREIAAGAIEDGFDAAGLERECLASYTCELERQVLRAALYGEPIPAGAAAAAGNEVELF